MKDSWGLYGALFHFAEILILVGGAFIIFLYLWLKGRLDMDEEPKMEMMKEDE